MADSTLKLTHSPLPPAWGSARPAERPSPPKIIPAKAPTPSCVTAVLFTGTFGLCNTVWIMYEYIYTFNIFLHTLQCFESEL